MSIFITPFLATNQGMASPVSPVTPNPFTQKAPKPSPPQSTCDVGSDEDTPVCCLDPYPMITMKKKPMRNDDWKSILDGCGYKVVSKITNTLQGTIHNGMIKKTGQLCVIKRTSKQAHKQNIALKGTNGRIIKIQEDIIREAQVMTRLTKHARNNNVQGFVKFIDFLEDNDNYYLIMEHGGDSLFEYVKYCHKLIRQNKLKLVSYKKHVKALFIQMVKCLNWMHNHERCCHLDISLENFLIKGATIDFNKKEFTNDGRVTFCDFGLAEIFPANNFQCKKFVGKKSYKSPKVYFSEEFDARKADIWSLGVCLYMMCVQAPLYLEPSLKCPYFKTFYNGLMLQQLESWGKRHYMDRDVYQLLMKMLAYEKNRILTQDIIKKTQFKN